MTTPLSEVCRYPQLIHALQPLNPGPRYLVSLEHSSAHGHASQAMRRAWGDVKPPGVKGGVPGFGGRVTDYYVHGI